MILIPLLYINHFHTFIPRSRPILKEALNLSYAGYPTEALALLKSQYSTLHSEQDYLLVYGNELMKVGNFKDAGKVFLEAARVKPANFIFQKLGDCHLQQREYGAAEKYYIIAVYMVPNRFSTRFSLYNFYKETNQNLKARKVRSEILKLPIKVKSEQVKYILNSVKQDLY